jgi:hypothetical protein
MTLPLGLDVAPAYPADGEPPTPLPAWYRTGDPWDGVAERRWIAEATDPALLRAYRESLPWRAIGWGGSFLTKKSQAELAAAVEARMAAITNSTGAGSAQATGYAEPATDGLGGGPPTSPVASCAADGHRSTP